MNKINHKLLIYIFDQSTIFIRLPFSIFVYIVFNRLLFLIIYSYVLKF